MKYLLVALLFLVGCTNDTPRKKTLPSAIGRFTDGNVTCWTYYENSISCIRDASVDER